MIYRFNDISLDTSAYLAEGSEGPIAIEPRVFDLLLYLIEHRERVVSREELLASIWQGRVVGDAAVSACLKATRKAVGDSGQVQKVIKTVHGRGYQFVARVESGAQDGARETGRPVSRVGVPTLRIESFSALPERDEIMAFAEELHDQITVCLSRRTGVRLLQQINNYTSVIARPDYVLSGRIRYIASRYSITLNMVWCENGQNVWTRAFTGDAVDPARTFEEVADTVDAALRYEIPAFDARRFADQDESQLGPDELLTKAAEYFSRLSLEDLHYAISLIDKALDLKPDDAMALAMRVDTAVHLASVMRDAEGRYSTESLSRMIERSVELNPHSDYAYSVRSGLRLIRLRDFSGALEDGRRSVELSPNFSWGFSTIGQALICLEKADKAIEPLQRSETLSDKDPWRSYHGDKLALALFLSGDLDRALKKIESLINLHPGVWTYHHLKAAILRQKNDDSGAALALETAQRLRRAVHILAAELPLPEAYYEMLASID